MRSVPPVRVLIADDHQLFAESLGLTLNIDDRLELVGTARNGKEAVRLAQELRPDIVLMDLDMPVMDGFGATREVRRSLPNCEVIVLTASLAVEDAHRARSAGAAAYLTKGIFTRDLIDALLEVALPTNQRKEETADVRGLRAPRAAGRPRPLLQSRAFITH